jgi:hypothetical protein
VRLRLKLHFVHIARLAALRVRMSDCCCSVKFGLLAVVVIRITIIIINNSSNGVDPWDVRLVAVVQVSLTWARLVYLSSQL